MASEEKYIAFLRGINVGGHHKVSMADLRKELATLNLRKIETLLNSGNIIFEAENSDGEELQEKISVHLERAFNFPVPVVIVTSRIIKEIFSVSPFSEMAMEKNLRLYVTFLKNTVDVNLKLPWSSENNSFKIIETHDKVVLSIVDLSVSTTPDAMKNLEKIFGKYITTRNWNTIEHIRRKL